MPNSIQSYLISAEQQLKQAFANDTFNPRYDAELLLAHVLQQSRSYLHAHPEALLTTAQADAFSIVIARRAQLEPIPYIIGTQEFWSLEFTVTPHTLIPRPETELLVETTLDLLRDKNQSAPIHLLDLGTGSGAIAIALAHEEPSWQIVATDISEDALIIAQQNANTHHADNISFYQGAWYAALFNAPSSTKFNAIISNPPYITEIEWPEYAQGLKFEPKSALTSGQDGLDAIREIIQQAKSHLKPGGYLLLEHGYAQGAQVRELMQQSGCVEIRTKSDLSNQDRITLGRYL